MIGLLENNEYYKHLERLKQLLSLSRICIGDGKKLLEVQKYLYNEIIEFEERINNCGNDEEVFMYKHLRTITKSITDGIFWRETGYNRVYLSMLSYAKGPGNIKEDISNTIQKVETQHLIDENIVFINDISNFIRVGDYTVIQDKKIIDILEVKGKKIRGIEYYKNNKTGRQSGKMVETFNCLHNHPTKHIFIRKNYFEQLKDGIKKSYQKGYSIIKLNKYTFIRIIYYPNLKDENKLFKEVKKIKRILKQHKNDNIQVLSNHDFYVNKNNRYATSVIAPYSIFPLDDITCIHLMSGILQVATYINISGIKREFEKENWSIEETRNTDIKKETKIEDINANNMFYENEVDMSLFKIRKSDGYNSIFTINELQFIALEFKSYKELIRSHNEQYEEAKKMDRKTREYLATIDSDKEIFY